MKVGFASFVFVLWTFCIYKLGQSLQNAKDFIKIDALERENARLRRDE